MIRYIVRVVVITGRENVPNNFISYKELEPAVRTALDKSLKEIFTDVLGVQEADVLNYMVGAALDTSDNDPVFYMRTDWFPRDDVEIQDRLAKAGTAKIAETLGIDESKIEIEFGDIAKEKYYIGGRRLGL